ncbi:MAG: VCBS repeat-containing protein [Kiritimatiellae bacterium]|nr:VCBS repeat-containing protein [Kiritimatiellia bacterium]
MKSRSCLLFALCAALPAAAAVYYVDGENGTDVAKGGGRSWSKAFKTLQFAAKTAPAGSTIIVTNGVYAPFATGNKKLSIRSVNGAGETAIEVPKPGGGFVDETICADFGKWGEEKVYDYNENGKKYWTGETREVLKGGTATVLKGFTIRNSANGAAGGTFSECVFSNLTQTVAAMSSISDSVIADNACDVQWAENGENAMLRACTVQRCRIVGNSVVQGAWNCTMANTLFAGNWQTWEIAADFLDWDAYHGNLIEGGTLYNCTVAGNTVKEAEQYRYVKTGDISAVYEPTGEFSWGAAVASANCHNSVVWGNFSDRTAAAADFGALAGKARKYTLDSASDIAFRDAEGGDWRIMPWSPARDAGGDYRKKAGSYDIDGRPRKIGTAVDAGAFEHPQGIPVHGDWDGDGKADEATYCSSTFEWMVWHSGSGEVHSETFGEKGAVPVVADWDGDGKVEAGYFTATASKPEFVRRDAGGDVVRTPLGQKSSTPLIFSVLGDAEPVFAAWSGSSAKPALAFSDGRPGLVFGSKGAKAVTADFDGDGTSDFAVYTSSASKPAFSILSSKNGYSTKKLFPAGKAVALGAKGSLPAVGDFDGDGKADPGAYSSAAATPAFFRIFSSSCYLETRSFPFGKKGSTPVPADWDGDGMADPAVFGGADWIWIDSSWSDNSVRF